MQPSHQARRRHTLGALLGGAMLFLARPVLALERTVRDMAGRLVRLPPRIERIASAGGSPAVNTFLFLFAQGERIVTGLPTPFLSPMWRFQRLFAPQIASAPAVSGPPPAWTPNLESLLALRPDISFVVSETAAQLLERAALPAVVLKWERLDSIQQTVQLLAEVFSMPERARAYQAWSDDLVNRVRQRLPQGKRPRVLYLRYTTLTQPILVPANHLIAEAGGDSVTAAAAPLTADSFQFSVEQVLAWQPEVILLAFGEEREQLLADPRLSSLPAVRKQRIHGVPHGAHIWTHYTPEQPLGILWLAKLLYPESFSDIDLIQESREFYRRFFGKILNDSELAAIFHQKA